MKNTGVVVIGRNEGERLEVCLNSVISSTDKIVYVDSGSKDNSVRFAREIGVEVVNLDMATPFTAARARNEGFNKLLESHSSISYVQFVDGDCEVVKGWMSEALTFLNEHLDVAVVCGRRRERFPEQSVYNLLCDIEWDTPVGEAKACGGDAMMRVEVFNGVGGFNIDMIAGEEPELCVRLQEKGWKIWRLGHEMTIHDAALTRFSQWWKRNIRAGFAFAEGAFIHGHSIKRHNIRESRRSLLWGLLIPFLVLVISLLYGMWALYLLFIYPLQVIRLAGKGDRSTRDNWIYACSLVLCNFPEVIGQIRFQLNRLLNRKTKIIEYK